jgi:hypothetical protein
LRTHCFQDRLHDGDGNEVAFDNLAQVRELVRRAYLASGLGPGGAASPAATVPPVEPGGTGGSYYEQAVAALEIAGLRWFEGYPPRFTSLRRPELLVELARLVQHFAEATLLEWERAVEMGSVDDPENRQLRWALREWYLILAHRRVWPEASGLRAFVNHHNCPEGVELSYRLGELPPTRGLPYTWHVPTEYRRFSNQALLQTAPCPLRRHWDPRINRLLDKLLLSLSDPLYFKVNNHVAELAPAVLSALISLPNPASWHDWFDYGDQSAGPIDHALTWLEDELPAVPLPDEAAVLLSKYAWRQLGGDGGRK